MTVIADSNIWIFAEIKDAPEHAAAVGVIRSLLSHGVVGTNVVVVSEVFHKLARFFGATRARQRVQTVLLHPGVQWMGIGQETTGHAMALAEEARIRINDALIAAQALEVKAKVLTDNVRDFTRIRKLRILPLR